MADPSASSASPDKLEVALILLTNQQLSLTSQQHSLGESMTHITHRLDELILRVTPFFSPSHPPNPTPIPTTSSISAIHHQMKLDVPRFDGTDPLGWIFKINQYFEYHGTPEHVRLTIASFYMEGRALAWFQWMTSNGQFTSWPVFLQALQTQFAPS